MKNLFIYCSAQSISCKFMIGFNQFASLWLVEYNSANWSLAVQVYDWCEDIQSTRKLLVGGYHDIQSICKSLVGELCLWMLIG